MITHKSTLASLCVLMGVLILSSSPALAARGHVFGSSFGKAGSGPGEFSNNGAEYSGPSGVAVNEATGDVYVLDTEDSRVERFSSSGKYLGQFDGSGTFEVEGTVETGTAAPGGQLFKPRGLAVDNSTDASDPSKGDVYVATGTSMGDGAINKFSARGEYIGQISFGFDFDGNSVAVDPKGELWVDVHRTTEVGVSAESFTDAVVNEPNAGEVVVCGPGPGLQCVFEFGLAVDAQDNLYVRDLIAGNSSTLVKEVSSSGVVLNEGVGEGPAGSVAVESSTGDAYLGNATTIGRFDPAGGLVERFGAGHVALASGLAVDSSTGVVYAADSSTDMVDVFPLEPPATPRVESESVSEVTVNSAALAGEINPRSENTEQPTEYHFDYGPCASLRACAGSAYEHSTPVASLSPNFEVDGVGVRLQGLRPGTPYHFRVVAENGHGPEDGEEKTFTTQALGGPLVLPDGRAWELVTPVDKRGGSIEPIGEGVVQSSVGGEAFTYLTSAAPESQPQGNPTFSQVLARRGVDGGWANVDIGMPHSTPSGIPSVQGQEYRFFSADLTLAIAEPFGSFSAPESEIAGKRVSEAFPEATERTPYLRHDSTCRAMPGTCYEPLLTGAEGYADVPEGTHFGGNPKDSLVGDFRFVDGTTDGRHVVLQGGGGLYEFSAGSPATERLQLVSAGVELGSATGHGPVNNRHAISDDGSRIFISSKGTGQLLMRDMEKGETVQLNVTEDGSGATGGFFQTADADGSKAFFTDKQPLTKDAGATGEDLYRCEIVEVQEPGGSKLKCDLSDLTPVPAGGQPGAGESAGVQGTVLGASEDGSYVYFVADGVQAEGATPGDCNVQIEPAGATCGLYVSHDGRTSFIATLSGEDHPDWSPEAGLKGLTSRVSPDGQWLAFMSDRELTGYDNRDAVSGRPDEEVYLYDAVTGKLVCASCDPTGARPNGVEYDKLGPLVSGPGVWDETTWIAANIPGWTPYEILDAVYQSRYLSDEGRLFFNSSDALVPQDTNGEEDVYEYEPAGVGGSTGCMASLSTFSERSNGCVGLISSGAAAGESAFLDASESGGDVFFLTSARLVPEATEPSVAVYDAHECTASSPCAPAPEQAPPECKSAAACREAPAAQPSIYGPPASATFSGAGNVASPPPPVGKKVTKKQAVKCAKGKKLSHGKCVKTVKKKSKKAKKAKKATKASNDRRIR